MSAAELLAGIVAALLLQVFAGLGLALRRRHASTGAPSVAGVPEVAAAAAATGAWAGWRDFRVVRRVFEDAAQTQCSFHLQAVDGVPLAPFLPGQYLTFALPLGGPAAAAAGGQRDITRCYSLSDRPDAAGYRITVKRVPPPMGRPDLPPGLSFSHFHDRVQVGDVLKVKAPAGRFFIDADASVPAVFIAGGIGITPMMSMLRWCLAEQPGRMVHLYHGVSSSGEQAFKRVLEDLAAAHPAFKLTVVCARPGPEDRQGPEQPHVGRIDRALLRGTLPQSRHHYFVCGPPPMMQSLVAALRAWGVPAEDIHVEAFGPATLRPTGPLSNEPAAALVLDA